MSKAHNIPDKVDTTGGFTVPGNYFEDSRRRMLIRVQQGGFDVPENYFEQQKIKLIEAVRPNKQQKRFTLNPVWYAAASLFLVASIGLGWYKSHHKLASNSIVSDDEIINYVVQQDVGDVPVSVIASFEHNGVSEQETDIIIQLDEETLINEL